MAGSVNMSDASAYQTKAIGKERVLCQGAFTIGTSGAVSASVVDDPVLTLGNDSGTGVHALTFPKCPGARLQIQLISASLTVSEATLTALSTTAGTASITLTKAGTPVQAASGNIIHITVLGKVYT